MTPSLTWTQQGDQLQLIGRIDEHADLDALAAVVPGAGVTLDLAGLTRINSIGVRAWMDFVAQLAPRPIRLVRCATTFVEQLNAIANFAGAAEVVSVLEAFECESDGEVVPVEVSTVDALANRMPMPPRCPRCGAEMIPAHESDLYFRFLRYKR